MNAKTYLIVYYSIAGVIIALFTAVMTYMIIGVPIGQKMIFKIFLTILVTLPIIGMLSYLIGVNLSKRLTLIRNKLNDISEDKFLTDKYEENITDISAIHDSIHQLSHRLEESISKLKNSNQQLNNMILSLSHDIKTPLTIIEGYLEELEDGMVTEDVIATLKKETAYINELSSEVIHYLQSLESKAQKEAIALKEFLDEEVCPLLRVEKFVTLKCEIEDDFSISFDRMALKNILVNLLHNATKHTKEGSITINSFAKSIVIEDTGVGIESKDTEMIFEPFYCSDESKNREKSGFGLGLSIAHNLAENNGYTLELDDSYKRGCRFILSKSE